MQRVSKVAAAVLAILTLAVTAVAQQPMPTANVSVTVDPAMPGAQVPCDFSGLSFEMRAVLPDSGVHLFRPDNQRLIALFKTLGVRNLRVGGASADRGPANLPSDDDLDQLFAFARAAGAKVIYTLPLQAAGNGVHVAKYLSDHYAPDLVCFSIGNEPTLYQQNYSAHRDLVKNYIAAVTAPDVAPDALFCGCSTTPGHTQWSREFANDLGPTGQLKFVGQHFYPGGSALEVKDPAAGRESLLDANIFYTYQDLYDNFVPAVLEKHLTYRLDETNSFYYGGRADVSDTQAAALWALDYMYWWAAHGAIGVNFQTGDIASHTMFRNPCWYAAFWSAGNGYDVRPLGYAMKTFDLGNRGRLAAVKARSTEMPNLRAYAVVDGDGNVSITLINREHGPEAKTATVSVTVAGEVYSRAQAIAMTAPGNDVAAKRGVTLGGAPIESDGAWSGSWRPLAAPDTDGAFTLEVAPASATVVRLTK